MHRGVPPAYPDRVRLWLACGLLFVGCGRTPLDFGRPPVGAGLDARTSPQPDANVEVEPPDVRRDAGPPLDASSSCVPARAVLTTGEIEVLFVIDRSMSMGWTPAGFTRTRWEAVIEVMEEVFADLEPRVGTGALLFPNGPTCALPDEPHVPIAEDNLDDVLASLTTVVDGPSPIEYALSRAYEWFQRDRPDRANRFVVLLSDGDPTVCYGAYFPSISVRNARELGIDTFGVAVAGDIAAIVHGAGRPYYAAADHEELRTALGEIEAALTGCVFDAPFERDPTSSLRVLVDGEEVPFDPSGREGWAWTGLDDRSISLYGDTCARRLESAAVVEAVVVCDADAG